MANPYWWLLDIFFVLIAVSIIVSCAKKGMTKVLVFSIGYLIASILASVVSVVAAPTLYETMARDTNLEVFLKVDSDINIEACFKKTLDTQKWGAEFKADDILTIIRSKHEKNFDIRLYEYVEDRCGYSPCTQYNFKQYLTEAFIAEYGGMLHEKLPNYVSANFTERMQNEPSLINMVLDEYYRLPQDTKRTAAYMEDSFGKDPTIESYQIFIYVIVFSLLMIITGVISHSLEYRIFFNILDGTDHFLGTLLGLVQAAMVLILLTLVVRLLVLLGGGEIWMFNKESIDRTYIFKYLYNQLEFLV